MADQDRCNNVPPHPTHRRFGLKDCPGVPMPRPVPSPEDRMRDARTDRPTTPIRGLRIFDQETSAAIRPLFDEIDQLRARAEAAEAERDEATEERDLLRAENANLTAGLRAERVKTGRLEGDLRSQTRAVREMKVDLERTDAQVKALAGTADTLHAVVEAAKLWRWWHGNTNAAYADACQALTAAVDALSEPQSPPLGSPAPRAQEVPLAVNLGERIRVLHPSPGGCDRCSVEPGERHRYPECPGNRRDAEARP